MKENLIKCTIRTVNGLIVEGELSHETIKKLKIENRVLVRHIPKNTAYYVSLRNITT